LAIKVSCPIDLIDFTLISLGLWLVNTNVDKSDLLTMDLGVGLKERGLEGFTDSESETTDDDETLSWVVEDGEDIEDNDVGIEAVDDEDVEHGDEDIDDKDEEVEDEHVEEDFYY
jgi:hypothetical protein